MKRTVFTLTLTLLLIVMLCPTTAIAQSWQYSGSITTYGDMKYQTLAFSSNTFLFVASGRYIDKWNADTRVWIRDVFVGSNLKIQGLAIPEHNPFFLVYAVESINGERQYNDVEMRYTSDLSWRSDIDFDNNWGTRRLAVSGNGDHLVFSTWTNFGNHFLHSWDVSARTPVKRGHLFREHRGGIISENFFTALAIDNGGNYYFLGDGDKNVDERHFGSGGINHVYNPNSKVISLAYQGGYFASGSENNRVHIWDYKPPKWIRGFTTATDPKVLAFSKDRKYLAAGTANGDVYVWKVSNGVLLSRLSKHSSAVHSVAFSHDGRLIASADWGDNVYIWRRSGAAAAPTATPQVETPITETTLFSNYPNPFNPETWIPYQLAQPAEVTVSIHAADGKLVRVLELGNMPAGVYQDKDRAAYWDGKTEQGEPVASGVYFYTFTAGDFTATRKMLVMK